MLCTGLVPLLPPALLVVVSYHSLQEGQGRTFRSFQEPKFSRDPDEENMGS